MSEDENVERSEVYKGHTIKILWDRDPTNPCKEFDSLGSMVCFHSRYDLGHEQPRESPEGWLEAQVGRKDYDQNEEESQAGRIIDQLLAEFEKDHLVLPLFLYDHSGISISTTSFHGRAHHADWDSGQVGWVYVSHKDILKEYSRKRITQALLRKAAKVLEAEVGTYDDYLTGMVFGYSIEGPEGVESSADGESCYGFFGYPEGVNQALDDAKGIVDHAAGKIEAQAQEKAAVEIEALQY